ncbi:benzoate transporter [Sulfuricella sp. T08]|uniref:glycosyltransferase family 2 protein n=1 Tax=Sulfuricella sp. T08 TaxID=1632857 RepID=UPI0006179AD8|nr:glycosyltransferase family 2 protein [Sulfuricella sp. T08]GAO34815.1 benzoate transporter [Sulfuricella sp. T08]
MQQNPPLSVVIIALNAASQIEACLKSAAFVDEVVVVDSGSRDDTREIALKYGARVLHQDWLGFGRQKQFAVEQASHDWVLCLDADERISDPLRASIVEALQAPRFRAYRMPRCNRFMGRWLRHGEGYPDWSLRLFDRRVANWSEDVVHEKVLTDSPVGSLLGDLLHESQESLAAYLEKQNRYTSLQADELCRRGKQVSFGRLVASPLLRFVKFYFLRLGFLDGFPGLVHIAIGCFNSFVKYAKLYELNKKGKS